jgi:light-regulated signal transduction histidine kinase (bacteriophytochrome)
MGTLVDDLLQFSRLGRAEMRCQPVNLSELVYAARKELGPSIAEREVIWKIADLPVIEGDGSLLRQVFVNLLSNALKYSRHRKSAMIEVGMAEENEREITLFVRDNGVGFEMKYVNKLFGVFQRLHSPKEFEGTGIGLANVRRITHRHGGQIRAEGVVNEGATFYLTLPRKQSIT